MPWSIIKFSQLILKGNVWRSVWRICMWILGLNGLNAIAHFPIFLFLHTSILDIIIESHTPVNLITKEKVLFTTWYFWSFIKIAKRSKHEQDNQKRNGVPEAEVTLFSKMVQEAGLHLNEGQAHDELGKSNPANIALFPHSAWHGMFGRRDVCA